MIEINRDECFNPSFAHGRVCPFLTHLQMSRVMKKTAFCMRENKDAEQLRGTVQLIIAFIIAPFRNPEDRVSRDAAHLV